MATEFAPPCVLDKVACTFASVSLRGKGNPEHCIVFKDQLVAAGGASALEVALGCPQRALRDVMHAAVDGDEVSQQIDENMSGNDLLKWVAGRVAARYGDISAT